jgi:hypothetical protein
MDSNRSRTGVLVGLAAAVGAFGAAAMMSAATAPTARADAFSDIISSVEDDFAGGQADFASASADFGSGDPSDGLALFFSGLDDDVVGPGDSVYLGTVDALLNEPTDNGGYFFEIGSAADFTSGLGTHNHHSARVKALLPKLRRIFPAAIMVTPRSLS